MTTGLAAASLHRRVMAGGQPPRPPEPAGGVMKWNLRLAAANRGIWKASELQRMLAEARLVISAGKMSGLWSGHPASIKLDDLDVICAVVGCGVQELLITEPGKIGRPAGDQPGRPDQHPAASSGREETRHARAP
jgi:DNA-binding Xre family transcriptional regulator